MEKKMEEMMKAMASVNPEDILHDHRPFLVVCKDGSVRRFTGLLKVPAGVDSLTGVESKDVVISPETGNFVRIYKPPSLDPNEKVPLLIYFHGGGFVIESAASPGYHIYLNSLSSKAKVMVVSVEYRLAPEHPIPAAYDDAWWAVKWASGAQDEWLKAHSDYNRVFFVGDSAGGNITHQMAMRVGKEPVPPLTLNGIVLVHPFFWGEERIGSEGLIAGPAGKVCVASKLWKLVCPETSGLDDPRINPGADPDLAGLGCGKVLVFVAEEDELRDRGFYYKEALVKSGWKGSVEVVEAIGENHVFHLFNPDSENAVVLMNRVVAFLNSTATATTSTTNN